MFEKKHKGRIKNDKINRWRLELSCYSFDIQYRPGIENVAPDALSRAHCASILTNPNALVELHKALCHPGVTRMTAFIRSKNLPYSVEEVKRMTSACRTCNECKPTFYKPPKMHLIKSTQPFERLNIDFKGPLPSNTTSKYMLTIIDEFSRFPFAFPCKDMTSSTVIACLSQLFAIFGMPAYIHSDRGQSFLSHEIKSFLHEKGIATSRTTPYNPQSNGQCERYNGIIWKTVNLALKTNKLPLSNWVDILPDALHSIRSLLSTATNCTPHERLFSYQRRSSTGHSVPSWLLTPGPVLLKRFVRNSKFEPLVDEVELIEANPQYAHVRYPDGRESTVSLRHLSPRGDNDNIQSSTQCEKPVVQEDIDLSPANDEKQAINREEIGSTPDDYETNTLNSEPRRSVRVRKAPERLDL